MSANSAEGASGKSGRWRARVAPPRPRRRTDDDVPLRKGAKTHMAISEQAARHETASTSGRARGQGHGRAPQPSPLDLYNVDSLFSEDERLVRDTVRKFVRDQVLPIIGEHFEAGTFPRSLIPQIAEMGLFGMHLEGYGCAGLNAVSYGLACQELEYGDSGLRSFVSVQGSLAMFPIWAFGSEEQKQAYLPKMAAGELIGCFGLTEPDSGRARKSVV